MVALTTEQVHSMVCAVYGSQEIYCWHELSTALLSARSSVWHREPRCELRCCMLMCDVLRA